MKGGLTGPELEAWWLNEARACGCGEPEYVLALLQNVLTMLDRSYGREWNEKGEWFGAWRQYNPAMHYLALYVLSALGLEEHGGSVPGWITAKGKVILEALRRLGTNPDEWNPRAEESPDLDWAKILEQNK